MLLPTFVTGGGHNPAANTSATRDDAPAPPASTSSAPPRVAPVNADRLPSDERNMLIFVTALLALGTLAIVAMASLAH